MSEPTPETPEPGILSRAEKWVEEHVAPDLAKVKADAERFREVLPELAKIANMVAALAKAVPPYAPEAALVADVVKAAEVIAEIAGELAAGGM